MKRAWHELRRGEPGRRFRDRHARRRAQRRHGAMHKWLVIAAGALAVLAGLALLPLPGPGMIVIALGAVLIAEESRGAARGLDWLELKVRSLFLSRVSGPSR